MNKAPNLKLLIIINLGLSGVKR